MLLAVGFRVGWEAPCAPVPQSFAMPRICIDPHDSLRTMSIMKKWPIIAVKFALLASSPWWVASCANRPGTAATVQAVDPLNDFYLAAPVNVRGLSPSAALEKVRTAYENTCRQTGDAPLKLAFEVPPGEAHEQPLRLQLGERSVDQSIRAVAAAAKWEVERSGATYRFMEPRETGRLVRRTFDVPPDFSARVAGPAPLPRKLTLRDAFRKSGVDLEESTRLFLTGSRLDVESRSAADMAAISGKVDSVKGRPVQQQISTHVVELPARSKQALPQDGGLDPEAASRLLADLAAQPGVKCRALPAFTMRVGEDASAEYKEMKLEVKTGTVGLQHQLQTSISYKPAGPDSSRTEARDRGYAVDGGSRLTVKTHADGSRTVFLVAPSFIDATGRPLRGGEPEAPSFIDGPLVKYR